MALVALVFTAYTPALNADFIWDDEDYVENNANLRSVSGLANIWLVPKSSPQYYPLVHTTFWLDYQLWGLDPAPYHLVNVLLHSANAILLWRTLVFLGLPAAWFAAALFGLHPVHVESVAWITERKNVLSGCFYLAAAFTYLRFERGYFHGGPTPWKLYAQSLLLFAAALLSKTVTATLPCALLLIVWWQRGRIRWRDVLPMFPMFAIAIPLGLHTAWLERTHVGAQGPDWEWSAVDRVLIAGRAIWFYFGKLLFPVNLMFIYPRWHIDPSAMWQWLFPLSSVAVIPVCAAVAPRIGRGPLVAALFFGGTLAPALGFFNVYPMRYSFVADHFQYLASISILVLLVVGGQRLLQTIDRAAWRRLVSAGFLAIFGVLTWLQCGVYANRETLWTDTLSKNPACEMAHTNLGLLYLDQERLEDAQRHFELALQLRPTDPVCHNNLGNALSRNGNVDEAIRHLQQAIAGDPNYAEAHNNLGALLTDRGEIDAALPHLRMAARLLPEHPAVQYNLSRALAREAERKTP